MDLSTLQATFGLTDRLQFITGPGGMPHAQISTGGATASVAVQGGHILTYQPAGAPPLLWVSREAVYAQGRSVRGGIPICWPWFGPHPTDPTKPDHGFARKQMWQVIGSGEHEQGVWLRLSLSDNPDTLEIWPHAFTLELTVTVGVALEVALTVHNRDAEAFSWSGALHTYLNVADVTRCGIMGLEDTAYFDKLTGQTQTQSGPVVIRAEVDRVYQDTVATCLLEDPGLGHTIQIAKAGSRTTVVWNPWIEKSQQLADFADDEYPTMVCIETANALDDTITLLPGNSHTTIATLQRLDKK